MNKMSRAQKALAAGVALAATAGSAMADGPDATVITTAIAAAVVTVGLVGTAKLGLHVAVAAFKWVRQAMST
ncbi:major capsid protein [Variovorax sp. Varisp36]|uniref:major capsid protein n=1 Tax=Variovorax sp. Varisp36 TaxID=3243031 RepID=UPI0039A5DFD1